uniref:Cytochrome P450 n=1 Tax=Quercus lobata TaxID=97700 RepID=A0A7N2MEC7_QUELO
MDHLAFWLILPIVWACIHVLTAALGGRKSGSSTLPPGPRPFPIIGNILELGNKPHQDVAKLSKTYGSLMTLKLGSITTIVISSPDIAKEALQKNDQALSSRTIPDSIQVFNHPKNSMAWLPALARWRNLRKLSATKIFAPQQLDGTQALRQKKVKELFDHVDQCCSGGEVVDIGRVAFITVLNTISNTFFSIDLAQYSSNLQSQEFQDLIFGIMELLGKSNIVDYFPALRLVDPQGIRKRMKSYFTKLIGIFDGIIKERVQLRASSEGSKASNDVLDSFLNLTEEDNSELSCDDFKRLLLDLFIAGIDTTSSTVEWALSELIHNPEKMAKARDELKEVLGKDRLVQEVDISKFPFLRAIVKETLRLHPPAPFLVPHKAETNVEMRGFIVPKNAQILVNVWAMGRDSSIWTNPNLFMPERFLEQDIDFKGKNFELIPFGAGRRICPGLPFANRMVPLMLASLVHFFNWKLADEMNPEDMDMSESETFGLTLHRAKPLRVIPTRV